MPLPLVELIPLSKGNRVHLEETKTIIVGRTPEIGCPDNRISRRHAELSFKADGTVWIKAIHSNPTFFKTKTNGIVRLTQEKEYRLENDDEFGLLPDEYFFRISIQPHSITEPSTIPKSPPKEEEPVRAPSPTNEQKIDSNAKTRVLPSWLSDTSSSTADSHQSQKKANTTQGTSQNIPQRTENRKKVLIYDDSDEEAATSSHSKEPSTIPKNHADDDATDPPIKRERCPYGSKCYRKNPVHRQEAIHPGDPDWKDEEEQTKDGKKAECPYGDQCFRTNADHHREYSHPRKRTVEIKRKTRSGKRKTTDDEEEEEDALPNEYDYNDSFIDDEDLEGSPASEPVDEIQSDGDTEWKPERHRRRRDETDDSSDDSEFELAKKEADEFVKSSKTKHHQPKKKKSRHDSSTETDED